MTITYFLVEWRYVNYNIGNYFDGKVFTAPKTGLYSFYATAERLYEQGIAAISVYVNGSNTAISKNCLNNDNWGSITVQTTLKIDEDDNVDIRLLGKFASTHDIVRTYFEGRLISILNE